MWVVKWAGLRLCITHVMAFYLSQINVKQIIFKCSILQTSTLNEMSSSQCSLHVVIPYVPCKYAPLAHKPPCTFSAKSCCGILSHT